MLRLEKNGDAPRAALRFALGYLIMPLWGGGNEKTWGQSVCITLWNVLSRFRLTRSQRRGI
jgi:hypothetical protein